MNQNENQWMLVARGELVLTKNNFLMKATWNQVISDIYSSKIGLFPK